MKYVMLIHFGDAPRPGRDGETNTKAVQAFEQMSDEDKQAFYTAYQQLNQTPGVTPGTGLQPPEAATTVRVQDGRTLVTDGPFAELKEAVNGFFLLDAEDLDAAIEIASRIPQAQLGGGVEIRPAMEW